MRILLISHTCQSRTEGQPKAEALARIPGVDVCVLVPDRWKRYGQWRRAEPPLSDAFRYEVGRVRRPWMGPAQTYLHSYPRLGRLIRTLQPDVIDLWEEPWSLVSVQACWLRNRLAPSAKLISETEQNIDKKLPPPFEVFRRRTLAQADYLVGRSEEAVQVVRRKGYTGPAEVVPNAVDTGLFRPMDRSRCRSERNLTGFVVGYFGRLVEAKGVTDLIDAIARMRGPATLLLVGGGPDEQAFRERVLSRSLETSVRFLGPQPLEELPAIMNACDVLVLPSRTTPSWKEQFGRVLIEAQACGTPVVGSSSGGIPEVVGDAGVVVPEQNPGALASALDALASSPAKREQLGRIGLERVARTCTWDRVAQRMHDIYCRSLRLETRAPRTDAAEAAA